MHLLKTLVEDEAGTVYADKNHPKISRKYTTKNVDWEVYLVMRTRGTAYAYKDKH